MEMQDLWGRQTLRSAKYHVFHDESEPNKRWLLIGLLFVQTGNLDTVRASLHKLRLQGRQDCYKGEVHFNKLPASFDGDFGRKACVARSWLRFFQETDEPVFFSALAVDRHSPSYEPKRFSKDFHAYNRFTAMALKAGIAWHLGPENLDELEIHFVSDAKDRATRPDRQWADNFESYLPYRAQLDAFLSQRQGRHYPCVTMDLTLCDSAREDLLQLCDVLLGATQMALVAGSSRRTKRELGEMVVQWCQDLEQPPWQQQFGLHRKFNLWAFPNSHGKPCNRVNLALKVDNGQLSMFDCS